MYDCADLERIRYEGQQLQHAREILVHVQQQI